jgi:PTH1 family peptidyl-tRNA hydrolase
MQSEYVLGKWRKNEEGLVRLKIDKSVEAIELFGTAGITVAMNQVNNKEFSIE